MKFRGDARSVSRRRDAGSSGECDDVLGTGGASAGDGKPIRVVSGRSNVLGHDFIFL